jgi:hypothetical protein
MRNSVDIYYNESKTNLELYIPNVFLEYIYNSLKSNSQGSLQLSKTYLGITSNPKISPAYLNSSVTCL